MAIAILVAGCASQRNAPLLFGQTHSVGIAVGTNPASQTPEISVGYKDLDIAIIPTVSETTGQLIQGRSSDGFEDAYSTFGQFQTSVAASQVGLGKFFATGIAARRLADGFGCEISRGTAGCPTPPIP
jgi:hypothetical protein